MTPRPTHFPGLDGLRGIAILAVIGHNLQLMESPDTLIGRAIEFGLDRGWIGVQLFFVLSGFLITGILLDSQRTSNYYQSFFTRRALRIFPIYYLSLVVLFLVLPAAGVIDPAHRPTPAQQLPFWLYISNWTQPYGFNAGYVAHFWSLAVEEQFYLLWPFLLYQRSPSAALRVCIGVAVAALVARLTLMHFGVSPQAVYMFSICRMDALALGGALAAALRVPRMADWMVPRSGAMLLLALTFAGIGAAVTRGYPRLSPLDESVGYTILSISMTLFVAASVTADTAGDNRGFAWLRAAPLRTIGKYSYAMYIFHRPLNDLLGVPYLVPNLPHVGTSVLSTALYLTCATLVSLALAMLSYRYVERPFLRLKKRFAPRPEELHGTSLDPSLTALGR